MDWTALGLLVLAGLIGFVVAFNNGANDVANAFASAVGSKAISIEQAVVIAGVMNLAGAVLLGGIVSSTLITGVVDPGEFGSPGAFLAAMFAVMVATSAFVLAATFFGLPVSSSHAIVGSLIGVTIRQAGWGSVDWALILAIASTWIVLPVLSGLISSGLLAAIRRLIVRGDRPGKIGRLRLVVPYLVAVTAVVLLMVVMRGAAASLLSDRDGPWDYVLLVALLAPYVVLASQAAVRWWTADQADDRETVEAVFRRLQVGTSSYVAFAHGSNDVANAVSPLFAVALVVNRGMELPDAESIEGVGVPLLILALGGVGIASGVALLGHRVIRTLSERVTRIDNSKGFCVDFAAASGVVLASSIGLPVSTTHAATGGIVGTGIWERGEVDWKVLGRILLAWVVTVPAASAIAALMYDAAVRAFGLDTG